MFKNHLLQSPEWEKFQKSLGKKVIKIKGDSYSALAILEPTPVGNYLFVPYGPHLANQDALKPALEDLKKVAKKEKAIFIRIEPTCYFPQKDLKQFGAHKVKDIDPAETWVVDLPDANDKLLQKLPRRLRGYYNTHKNKGIEIIRSRRPEDIKHLARLQSITFAKKGIKPYQEDYLKQELSQDFSTLYLAKYDKKIIAAVLVFDYDKTRFYMQAASDKSYAKLNANGILTIQAILDAKEKGLSYFDFWGIAPAGAPANHPWAGFTAFKKMFAGDEKIYSGTYDIPVAKIKYSIYKLARKIKGSV